jgi:2-polyprenyl-6-methoxyphenol hydroxylase-like FAD-dependent oxidoreductase
VPGSDAIGFSIPWWEPGGGLGGLTAALDGLILARCFERYPENVNLALTRYQDARVERTTRIRRRRRANGCHEPRAAPISHLCAKNCGDPRIPRLTLTMIMRVGTLAC